jgi:transaldolase
MKFFLDTAHLPHLQRAVELGVCDGVTTNPTLIAREGKPHKQVIQAIAELVSGPISIETTANDAGTMIEQGLELRGWARSAVIKVPMTMEGLAACRALRAREVPVNVTLCFSGNQALLACKAGATYVSPFVGRLDDVGQMGMEVVEEAVRIIERYGFPTQVIASSIRQARQVTQAALLGAHVATLPFAVVEQLFHHPLTDAGQARFLADAGVVPSRKP